MVADAEGNFHIAPDVLERFRMMTNKPKRKPHTVSSDGIPPTEAVHTKSEYDKLLRAIKEGKVRTTQRGKHHRITRDELQKFQRLYATDELPPNGTIYHSNGHDNGTSKQ